MMLASDVTENVGLFDRFAAAVTRIVSRAVFFTCCVGVVVLWLPSIALFRDVDTWQLVINTLTTIITFLLVALVQNSQRRSDQALHHKLNSIAESLGDFMSELGLESDASELAEAVGLEDRESSSED